MDELHNNSSSVNKSDGFRSENRNFEESSEFPFQNLQYIMYAYGDVRHPSPDTVKLVYRILREQMNLLLMETQKVAQIQKSDMICLENIIFLLRKNKVKLKRLLRYLQVLDFRSINVSNLQLADGENTNPTMLEYVTGQNVKRCLQFLAQIEDCKEFTTVLQDKSICDPTMAFRAQRRNLMSLMMSREEYKEFSFIVPRATFCSAQRKGQFKVWLLADKATKLDISYRAITVINYLAIDTVAQLIDMAIINKVQKTSDNSFIDQMYLTDLESPGIDLYEEAMFYGENNSGDLDKRSDALSNNGMESTPTNSTREKNSCTSSLSGNQTSTSSCSLSSNSKTSYKNNSSSGSVVATADDASGTSSCAGTDSQSIADISEPESLETTRLENNHTEDKSQSLGEWSADLLNESRVIDDSASVEIGLDGHSSNAFPKEFSKQQCLISKQHSYCQRPLTYTQKYEPFEDISSDENPHQDDASSRPSTNLGESSFSHHDSRENVILTPDSSSKLVEKIDLFASLQPQGKATENFKDPKAFHVIQGEASRGIADLQQESSTAVGPYQKLTPEAAGKTAENSQSSVQVSKKSPAFYFSPNFKKLLDTALISKGEKTSDVSFTGQIYRTDRESSAGNLNEEAMVCGAGSTSDLDILNREAVALSDDGTENTSRDGADSAFEKNSCTSNLSANQESRSSCSLSGSNSKASTKSNFSSGSMVVIADDASGASSSVGTDSESVTYVAISEPESVDTTRQESIHAEDKSLPVGEKNVDMIDEYQIIDDSASNEDGLDDQSSSAYPNRVFNPPLICEQQHSSGATFELNYEQKCPLFEDVSSDENPHQGSSRPSLHLPPENATRTPDSSKLIEKIDLFATLQSRGKLPENQEIFKDPKTLQISQGEEVALRTTDLKHKSSTTAMGPYRKLTREAAGKTAENSQSSVQVSNRSPAFYFSPNFKKAFFRRTCLTPSDIKEAYASFQISRHPLAFFQNPHPQKTKLLCLLDTFDCVV